LDRFLSLCASGLLLFSFSCAQGTVSGSDAAPANDGIPSDDSETSDAGPLCGNAIFDEAEECDGPIPDGLTCVSLGYVSGELQCGSDCVLDKSGCVEDTCGNGVIDAGEMCESDQLRDQTCAALGFAGGGTLGCAADCTYETVDCSSCGDGVVDSGEECDGSTLSGQTCASRGYSGGTLSCNLCGFDESGCANESCGNGSREAEESCDGSDLAGQTCMNLGFAAGTLSCSVDCGFDSSGCSNCGNGSIDPSEDCDGSDLGGQTCGTQGFTIGTLRCTPGCGFDTSACEATACGNGLIESGETCDDDGTTAGDGCSETCATESGWTCAGVPSSCSPTCGDGTILGSEVCDGLNLGGATCGSRGFSGGTLRCTSCAFNEAACTNVSCGNGAIESGEECDDGNSVRFDGCDTACQVEATYELPLRLRNGDGSNHGMLEVLQEGAWRDVCDDVPTIAAQQAMADVVCGQLGFTGGSHVFISRFGGGTNTPVMDDVTCTGSETSLAQCPFRGWNQENCSATEAVGFRCDPGQGDIRLVDGPSGMEGRLQFFNAGAWGEVCDDYFDGFYAAYNGYGPVTVCQQLGYQDGIFLTSYDSPTAVFVLDDVNCVGSERRLGDCPHPPYGSENCGTTEGAGFRCVVPTDSDLRLVEGSARNRGRVEVLHSNVWGTVCDDFLTSTGARQTNFVNVSCGDLGFDRAGSALIFSAVADGAEPIWLDDVDCAGGETQLASCPNRGWNIENCSNSEDIGLACTP
jgi:cysteine-rich repeat protein